LLRRLLKYLDPLFIGKNVVSSKVKYKVTQNTKLTFTQFHGPNTLLVAKRIFNRPCSWSLAGTANRTLFQECYLQICKVYIISQNVLCVTVCVVHLVCIFFYL